VKLPKEVWQVKLALAVARANELPEATAVNTRSDNALNFAELLNSKDVAWQAIVALRKKGYRGEAMAKALNQVFELGVADRLTAQALRDELASLEAKNLTVPKLRQALEVFLTETLPQGLLDAGTVAHALRAAALDRRLRALATLDKAESPMGKAEAQRQLDEIKTLELDLDRDHKRPPGNKTIGDGVNAAAPAAPLKPTSTEGQPKPRTGTVAPKPVGAPNQIPERDSPAAAPRKDQGDKPVKEQSAQKKYLIHGFGKPHETALKAMGCQFDPTVNKWFHAVEAQAKQAEQLIASPTKK
jgi:hypothetical protein